MGDDNNNDDSNVINNNDNDVNDNNIEGKNYRDDKRTQTMVIITIVRITIKVIKRITN